MKIVKEKIDEDFKFIKNNKSVNNIKKYLRGEDLLRDDKFLTLVADLYSKIKEYTDYKDDVKAEEVLQFLDEYLEDHRDDDISVFDFFDWYRML